MLFFFNTVELCVVTINEKPWTRAREVRRALEYNKKTADIVKAFCSPEYYAQKYEISGFTAAGKPVNWPKDSQKCNIYINEEGMYEIVFSNQKPKAKDFRRHCCNVLFPHFHQRFTNKIQEKHQQTIEEKDTQIQDLEFTNEKHQQKILKLNKEIDDLIANRHVARRGCFDNVLCFITRIAEKFTHITLFGVNTSSLKNINDDLKFVTQTLRWLTNVMIQTPFTDGTGLTVK